MYVARLNTSDGDLVQAILTIPQARALERSGVAAAFHSHVRAVLSDPFSLGISACAYRVSLSPDGEIKRLMVFTAPADREAELRHLIARLLILEGLERDCVSTSLAREAFDQDLADWTGPSFKRDDQQAYTNMGDPVLGTGLLFDSLDAVVARFLALGWPFSYQVNAVLWTPEPDRLARAASGVARLPKDPLYAAFEETQRQALRLAARSRIHLEEFFACSAEAERSQLKGLIASSGLSLRPAADEDCAAIESGLHTLTLYGDFEPGEDPLSGARTPEAWAQIAAWRPPLREAASIGGNREDKDGPQGSRPGLRIDPTALDQRDLLADDVAPFVFVSYAHADGAAISALLRTLHQRGVGLWFDAGIGGAHEWDDVLERRLQDAHGVVAFLSKTSVASKYCRRELKFADAIGKPILPVLLEAVELKGGLGLMLGSVQALRADDPDRIASTVGQWRL